MSGICGKLAVGRSLGKLTPKQLGDEDEIDEDVKTEMDRVAAGGADNDVVKVTNLLCFRFVSIECLSQNVAGFEQHSEQRSEERF